jgi:hypothetical protein
MARKYTATKRLAQEIERNKDVARPVDIFDLVNDPAPDRQKRVREMYAGRATTLGTTHEDEVLRKAFKASGGLDPQDPRDWRRLLIRFSTVFYGNRRGGKTKWDLLRWEQFKKDVLEVMDILKKEEGTYPSDVKVAAHLCEKSPYRARYKEFRPATLRRYMTIGNSPKSILALRKKRL